MAGVKTKEQLTRLAWITELRRQGHRQCHGFGSSADGRQVCAMALLSYLVRAPDSMALPVVGQFAGLSEMQAWRVIAMNDGRGYGAVPLAGLNDFGAVYSDRKHTFAEIADVVAGWFPS